jgi:acetylornithine/succinyldiaminopimelate/putrescine aminotransferase/predicted amino acid dehydrogenase
MNYRDLQHRRRPDRTQLAPDRASSGGAAVEMAAHNPHFKPRLNDLLRTLRVDVHYERGKGDALFFRDWTGAEIEVLDLVGGYGSLLLGHAHPALVAEAQRLLACGRPMHAQGSVRAHAARLAMELSRRAQGDYCVLFGNSGAEAVEMSMKHALLETGGRTFIALERAFHGKTLGALQLTANAAHSGGGGIDDTVPLSPSDGERGPGGRVRGTPPPSDGERGTTACRVSASPYPFGLPGLNIVRVPLNDLERLEAAFRGANDLAGFVLEPILGEGGVRPVDPVFAQRAAQLCRERGVPFIADECQTGLGRTGTFLACEHLGVRPDYITLSKALGGGLAKISAVLIRRDRYRDTFDLTHSSTYADDDFSCGIALKTLELIDDDLMTGCARKGDRLIAGLRRLADRYPSAVAAVRGRGLMIGIEFHRPSCDCGSFLMRFLGAQEDLVWVIMGYLLNVHRVRVAPTLGDRFTLRLEPSALVDDTGIEQALTALDDVCDRLAREDVVGLTRFLLPGTPAPNRDRRIVRSDPRLMAYDERRFRRRKSEAPMLNVGWLCHLVDNDDLVRLEPAFAALAPGEREGFLEHLLPRVAPVMMGSTDIRSIRGDMVRFHPILLPFTSRWVKAQLDARELAAPKALVQMGVDLARSLGCQIVSLGQYTSIVTRNGLDVDGDGIGLTTGNSYSVALAVEAIERAHRDRGTHPSDSVLVVVGAAGNIGRTCAELLAGRYHRTILVGSQKPCAGQRVLALARRIPNAIASTDPGWVTQGDVVVAALNAVDAPLGSEHFGPNAIVCDLSVPRGLRVGLEAARPDLLLIKGGIAALPHGEDLEIVGFPLPRGQVYGCMAEALLLGFAGVSDSTFTGPLTANHVERVLEISRQHGFALADYNRPGEPDSQSLIHSYADAPGNKAP